MDQDPAQEQAGYHRPVLVDEVVRLMAPVMPGVVVDATFGGGGHSRRMLDEFGDELTLIAIDRDPEALANAGDLRVTAIEGNFADLTDLVGAVTGEPVSGVLFDFGVSSRQLDRPERGFSYRQTGPLDMRMGPDAGLTADEVVNQWPLPDLAAVIKRFGEEPLARRIAEAIVAARPIDSTATLSTVIAEAMPAARRRAGHPARRTFQAIRIAVNGELDAIESGVSQAIDLVGPGGRVVAISYHSLEDRIVKQAFVAASAGCTCPPGLPVCGCGNTASARVLTRRAVRPGVAEVRENNRARSAVLRAVEKVAS